MAFRKEHHRLLGACKFSSTHFLWGVIAEVGSAQFPPLFASKALPCIVVPFEGGDDLRDKIIAALHKGRSITESLKGDFYSRNNA